MATGEWSRASQKRIVASGEQLGIQVLALQIEDICLFLEHLFGHSGTWAVAVAQCPHKPDPGP